MWPICAITSVSASLAKLDGHFLHKQAFFYSFFLQEQTEATEEDDFSAPCPSSPPV